MMAVSSPSEYGVAAGVKGQVDRARSYLRTEHTQRGRQAGAWPAIARFLAAMRAAENRHAETWFAVDRNNPSLPVGLIRGWCIDTSLGVTVDGWLVRLQPDPGRHQVRDAAVRLRVRVDGVVPVPESRPYLDDLGGVDDLDVDGWVRHLEGLLEKKRRELFVPAAPGVTSARPPTRLQVSRVTTHSIMFVRRRTNALVTRAVVALSAVITLSASFFPGADRLAATSIVMLAAAVMVTWAVTYAWPRTRPERTLNRAHVLYPGPGVDEARSVRS
jgi:hypothetical protein